MSRQQQHLINIFESHLPRVKQSKSIMFVIKYTTLQLYSHINNIPYIDVDDGTCYTKFQNNQAR